MTNVLKKPSQKCCKHPDVKNEGKIVLYNITNWEYHCYNCGKTWTEFSKNKS